MALSRHSMPVVAIRTVFCVLLFIIGTLCVRSTQILAHAVFRDRPAFRDACTLTKQQYIVLLVFLTQIINPSKIKISYDPAHMPKSNSFSASKGHLSSILLPNAVWISNHQIYTDWLYLWFILYTGRFSESVYIVLKDALRKIPVLGPGMTTFGFLFLLRKWETDKVTLTNRLLEIDADARGLGPASGVTCVASSNTKLPGIRQWPEGKSNPNKISPYQVIIFPEGTVISPRTRERSGKFSADLPTLKHVLLPRVRGLFLMLRLLRNTVEVVYDVATAYTGLTADDYGEEVFTLKAFYLKGYGPPVVHHHIRGFNMRDIPLGDDESVDVDDVAAEDLKKFEEWLYKVWYEKDELMATFYRTGSFVEKDNKVCKTVIADFKLRSRLEIFQPFMVPVTVLVIGRLAVKGLWALYKWE